MRLRRHLFLFPYHARLQGSQATECRLSLAVMNNGVASTDISYIGPSKRFGRIQFLLLAVQNKRQIPRGMVLPHLFQFPRGTRSVTFHADVISNPSPSRCRSDVR